MMPRTDLRSDRSLFLTDELAKLNVGDAMWIPIDEPESSLKHRLAMVRDRLGIDIITKWLRDEERIFVARFR